MDRLNIPLKSMIITAKLTPHRSNLNKNFLIYKLCLYFRKLILLIFDHKKIIYICKFQSKFRKSTKRRTSCDILNPFSDCC